MRNVAIVSVLLFLLSACNDGKPNEKTSILPNVTSEQKDAKTITGQQADISASYELVDFQDLLALSKFYKGKNVKVKLKA